MREEPTTHRQQRPPRRVKERKLTLRLPVLGRVLGNLSELRDFLQAIHDALPDEIKRKLYIERRGRKPRIPDLLDELYRHWDDVNLLDAAKNIIIEQGKDIIIGRASKTFSRTWLQAHDDLGITPPPVTPLFGRRQQDYVSFGRVRNDGTLYTSQTRRISPPRKNPLRETRRKLPQTAVDALFYR